MVILKMNVVMESVVIAFSLFLQSYHSLQPGYLPHRATSNFRQILYFKTADNTKFNQEEIEVLKVFQCCTTFCNKNKKERKKNKICADRKMFFFNYAIN